MGHSRRGTALVAALHQRRLPASRTWITVRFGKAALETGLRNGELVRVLEGQYAHRDHARTTLVRAAATSVWLGARGVVGGPTAAHLMALVDDPRRVHVVGRPRVHIRGPAWMAVRHRQPDRRTVMASGVEVACPEDAAIQTWEQRGVVRGARVVIECVRRDLASAESLAVRSRQYPTLRHRAALAKLLDDLAGGIDSFLELQAARTIFVGGRLSDVRRHVRLSTSSRSYVADFYHDQARLAIETDGRQFHSDDAARRRDLARDTDLATIGVQTMRLTYEDVMERPEWCRHTILSALAARLGRSAQGTR